MYDVYGDKNTEFIKAHLKLRRNRISVVCNQKEAFRRLRSSTDIGLILICGEIDKERFKKSRNPEFNFMTTLLDSEFKDIPRFYICNAYEFGLQREVEITYTTRAGYPENLIQIDRLVSGKYSILL